MNKKLIRIARYLGNNGFYKEASEIKKLAEFWDDVDTHKETLRTAVEKVLVKLKKLNINNMEDGLDMLSDKPGSVASWIENINDETECTWKFAPHGEPLIEGKNGFILYTNLRCESEDSNFFGCNVSITTNTGRQVTRVLIDFPDGDQIDLEEKL